MALMFAICNPHPNWMPRKPKLMFQICQNVRGGLSMKCFKLDSSRRHTLAYLFDAHRNLVQSACTLCVALLFIPISQRQGPESENVASKFSHRCSNDIRYLLPVNPRHRQAGSDCGRTRQTNP